jgi:drug/metabolite transporter (DMT)-like permease
MSPFAWGLLFLLGLLWGGSFFFARIAVFSIPPMTLVLLRLSIAAIALHLYIFGRFGIYPVLRRGWKSFLLLGLINNAIPHTLLFYGQTEIGAGLASILNATTPIWTILLAHLLTADEKLTGARIAGALIGLAGCAVLVGPGLTLDAGVPGWALALPVLAAMSYGLAAIFSRSFRSTPAPVIAAGQLTASSLIMMPAALVMDHPWQLPLPPTSAILSVLGLALASTAFAYILFFRIIRLAGATNASLVTLLVPASAILLGSLFLGERLEMHEVAGLVLVAFGLLSIDGRIWVLTQRRFLHKKRP